MRSTPYALLRAPWRGVLLLGLLCLHLPAALACGYCLEDKIASVYDHALVSRALSQKHRVVFFALDGPLAVTSTEKTSLSQIIASVPGVDPGSARVSLETATLSLSINTAEKTFAAVERALQAKLLRKGLSLQLLRVMDTPAEFLARPGAAVLR
jgi:hypothetical protein